MEYQHSDITEKIIGAAYEVYNHLGYGFLEKIYENALCLELTRQGLAVQQQCSLQVGYKGEIVGEYIADMVVENKVIIEIKAVNNLDKSHEAQLINYLKSTGIEVGLLINFGPRIDIKRRIFNQCSSVQSVAKEEIS